MKVVVGALNKEKAVVGAGGLLRILIVNIMYYALLMSQLWTTSGGTTGTGRCWWVGRVDNEPGENEANKHQRWEGYVDIRNVFWLVIGNQRTNG